MKIKKLFSLVVLFIFSVLAAQAEGPSATPSPEDIIFSLSNANTPQTIVFDPNSTENPNIIFDLPCLDDNGGWVFIDANDNNSSSSLFFTDTQETIKTIVNPWSYGLDVQRSFQAYALPYAEGNNVITFFYYNGMHKIVRTCEFHINVIKRTVPTKSNSPEPTNSNSTK